PPTESVSDTVTAQPLTTELGNYTSYLRDTLGLPHVSDGSTPDGTGVGVAVIDSGLKSNADFAGRITAFYAFTKDGTAPWTVPYDDYGHGAHVAGLIGASGAWSNNQFQGIAPNVTFVGLKVLDKNGQGSTSAVIAALQFITTYGQSFNVKIINLSLGHPI